MRYTFKGWINESDFNNKVTKPTLININDPIIVFHSTLVWFIHINDDIINSRYKRDIDRRKVIISITIDCIGDVHKTEIHRIHSLIKEYKNDIADPNIPNKVKEGLKEDLKELEKILDQYLNHKDEFR